MFLTRLGWSRWVVPKSLDPCRHADNVLGSNVEFPPSWMKRPCSVGCEWANPRLWVIYFIVSATLPPLWLIHSLYNMIVPTKDSSRSASGWRNIFYVARDGNSAVKSIDLRSTNSLKHSANCKSLKTLKNVFAVLCGSYDYDWS